jgi:hypothetical protein
LPDPNDPTLEKKVMEHERKTAVQLELMVNTQCMDPVKRGRRAMYILHQVCLALASDGETPPYQIKQSLEELAKRWSSVPKDKSAEDLTRELED